MDTTERAISHDEPGGAHWRSCTTLAHSKPDPLAPDDTIDEKVITVDWDGLDDPENPRKYASTSLLFCVCLTVLT